MIIFFAGIKGLDPYLAWDFDESKNYASCSLPDDDTTTQESSRKTVFKLPKGMLLENNTLVVSDMKAFACRYPYTKAISRKFENLFEEKVEIAQESILTLNSLFGSRSHSSSNSGSNSSNPEKSGKPRSNSRVLNNKLN